MPLVAVAASSSWPEISREAPVSTIFCSSLVDGAELAPREAVRVAARTEYQYVGLRLISEPEAPPVYPLMDNPSRCGPPIRLLASRGSGA